MLRRNLYFAPVSVKSKAYMACVRPILEYASSCWSPTTEKHTKMIEMVQHSAAKFALNRYPRKGHYEDFSISKLIDELGWDTLEARRNQAKLSMAFKILHGDLILPPESLPRLKTVRPIRKCQESRVGTANQLYEPESRLITIGKTFFYSVPSLWNSLVTPQQAGATSAESFKNHFKRKQH